MQRAESIIVHAVKHPVRRWRDILTVASYCYRKDIILKDVFYIIIYVR